MTYDALLKLPLVKDYEEAFFHATGVTLKLASVGTSPGRISSHPKENPFCRLAVGVDGIAKACWASEQEVQRRAGETLAPQTVRCFAGLEVVAAPVVVGGRHVATWIGGQVFSRQPTPADFAAIARLLLPVSANGKLEEIKTAFFNSPVVPVCKLQAMRSLLALFAQHLGAHAERHLMRFDAGEPRCVTEAKEFLEAHIAEPVTLAQVAAAVHVSRYHFCRLFHASTGLRFTEYLSRLRIERTKTLLQDPALRISEIAYAVGFGSISQFNANFRKWLGRSPTSYRDSLVKATES